MPRVTNLLEASRPLRWEWDDEDFSYGIGGTGFLVRFRRRHFLVTARHCLQGHDRNSLRVEIQNNSGVFNALKQLHTVDGPEAFHDLAFFEFDPVLNSMTDLQSPEFLDFDYLSLLPHYNWSFTSDYACRGYPTELNVPDYENRKLKCTSFSVGGRWTGDWIRPHCGAFKIADPITEYGIQDTDGFSGSPVFELTCTPGGVSYRFAGVVYWGIGQVLRFIESSIVFTALKQICR